MTFCSKLFISSGYKSPAKSRRETPATGKKVAQDGNSEDGSLDRTSTSLVSHNLVICGRRTTVRLEDEMWASLNEVAEREACSVHELASRIYSRKKSGQSFTPVIRVFLTLYYRDAATAAD